MGFHRRHLSDQTILSSAKNDFFSFQQMMTSADDYMLHGDFASCFWEFFNHEKEARESIWNILRIENEEERDKLISIVCKSWDVVTNSKNKKEQIDGINNYLDLAEIAGNESNPHIIELINILRNKTKEI